MLTPEEFREKILLHKQSVEFYMMRISELIIKRGKSHDDSKLEPEEFDVFYKASPMLTGIEFGSPEYIEMVGRIGKKHYSKNSHHPNFYESGIDGMSLLDIIEMLSDWKSASYLHGKSGNNILKSLEINKERFGISDQLYNILVNTVYELNWAEK